MLVLAVIPRRRRTLAQAPLFHDPRQGAAGLILYPLARAVEARAVFRLGGGRAIGSLLAAVLPTGSFALAWCEPLDQVSQKARGLIRFLEDRAGPRRLRDRRRAIVATQAALPNLGPEVWPEPDAPDP
jgi:hypothetical protein